MKQLHANDSDPIDSIDWISHRGLHQRATENTAEAFDAAVASGFRHLETDIRTCQDGHLVLAHDSALARIAQPEFAQLSIEQASHAQLAQVRLANGEKLVFFEQWLERWRAYRWILDIKLESAMASLNAILGYWRQPEYQSFFDEQVRFLFWHHSHQQYLLQQRPNAICMANLQQCRRAALSGLLHLPALGGIRAGTTYAVPPTFMGRRLLTQRLVRHYHARGARVLGYLPETQQHTEWAVAAGVDEVLTNGTVYNSK